MPPFTKKSKAPKALIQSPSLLQTYSITSAYGDFSLILSKITSIYRIDLTP